MPEKEPMIKLQPGGVAPIISYNVPEGTTYSGRNFIDLQFAESFFKPTQPQAKAQAQAQTPQPSMAASQPAYDKAQLEELGIGK
ncbi:MAG: hypothetical protein K0Q63_981, partial [Paenibacillus sp.]|nr:hypothetical protein [Paenibacillus sp.]